MGLCRGNRGNLMQHWALCEVLYRLEKQKFDHLHFVCTHSMAPWSVPERRNNDKCRQWFTAARQRLNGTQDTVFERAWHSLSPVSGLPYPSSAVFAQQIWKKHLSLLLCEINKQVADEIDGWLGSPEVVQRLREARLHRMNWRDAFQDTLPAGDADIILIELDPMRYEHHPPNQCSRNDGGVLFPEDIELILDAVEGLTVPIVLQISSFSANNGNSHEVVTDSIVRRLEPAGFIHENRIKVGGQMLCLFLSRGITLFHSSDAPETAFDEWLEGFQ